MPEQRRHEATGKRRPTGGFVTLTDASEVPSVETPESATTFDAAWANTVLGGKRARPQGYQNPAWIGPSIDPPPGATADLAIPAVR